MKRIIQKPRDNWKMKLEYNGFMFHSIDENGQDVSEKYPDKFIYWREDVAYQFNYKQIKNIENATNEVHLMCIEMLSSLVKSGDLDKLIIPRHIQGLIEQSFLSKEPHLYGRFDFSWDGNGHPKMLEYNADTPISIIESGISQSEWCKEVHPNATQFNEIHNALISRWKEITSQLTNDLIHFGCFYASAEEFGNVAYLEDCCKLAGFKTKLFNFPAIGYDKENRFLDDNDFIIDTIFKLYAWERFFKADLFKVYEFKKTKWIEPIWKAALSTKAILPILWEMFPNHPNLLEAHFSKEKLLSKNYVQKPILSREGSNIDVFINHNKVESTDGNYKDSGYVYQKYHEVPSFYCLEKTGWLDIEKVFTSIGSWVVGDKAVGIGVREDVSPITKSTAYFVPHYIES